MNEIKKIVVLGAGTMGLDIANVFAAVGKQVVVRDVADEILARASARLAGNLERRVTKGTLSPEEREALLGRIRFTTDIAAAADADLVLEAIVEKSQIKKSVFAELDAVCKPETIFATNTSSISITDIASATARQDRCIGMHFFNPATVMKLIEIIRGCNTSDDTFEAIRALSLELGKDPVEVEEAPGFVVNRLLVPMINEAIELVYTHVASVEDIDKAMRLGANHRMGPLQLGDFVGLDVVLAIMEVFYAETGDSKYRPSLLLTKMVRAGKLGVKTGEGFYKYDK